MFRIIRNMIVTLVLLLSTSFETNSMYVIFGGDLNTALGRGMPKHTKSLMQYCIDDDIICSGTIHVFIRKLYS